MSTSHTVLVWSVAVLALLAYVTGAMFFVQGFTPLTYLGERATEAVILAFAATCVLASLLALAAMARGGAPDRPAILRLPRSGAARWALGLTAVFYPAVLLFTGNTLFNLLMALGLPEAPFRVVLRAGRVLGVLLIVASAVGAMVLDLIALIKKRDRGLVLGLPMLQAVLVLGFILGEILVPH